MVPAPERPAAAATARPAAAKELPVRQRETAVREGTAVPAESAARPETAAPAASPAPPFRRLASRGPAASRAAAAAAAGAGRLPAEPDKDRLAVARSSFPLRLRDSRNPAFFTAGAPSLAGVL
ncbi:hypothetical protein GCM10027360_59680 [Amycolatopsis echigonensis]